MELPILPCLRVIKKRPLSCCAFQIYLWELCTSLSNIASGIFVKTQNNITQILNTVEFLIFNKICVINICITPPNK